MDHCPLCLKEASSLSVQTPDAGLQSVDCPACGSLVFTAGAVAFLNAHSADDPRRRDYSVALHLVQRSNDHPIDDTTLKLWNDWLQVSGPEKLAQLAAEPKSLRDA